MTVQDIDNFSIIERIVEENFDLSEESFNLFKEKLYDRPIFDFVKKELDDSLRKEIIVKKDNYKVRELFDTSWVLFKEALRRYDNKFIADENILTSLNEITYEEFANNKITINKNTHKLYKLLLKIIHNSFAKNLEADLQEVDTFRLSNKDLYIVISFNYADWFLSATNENWSSCLNLNSTFEGSYWASLPGLITDINRGMIYITDKKQKNFHGIKVDRIITRSWFIINSINEFIMIKFYPLNIINSKNEIFINNLFPMFNLKFGDSFKIEDVNSKEKFRLLKNNSGETLYPFQDISSMKLSDNNEFASLRIDWNKGNQFVKENNEVMFGTQYLFSDGLSFLINTGRSIKEFKKNNSQICNICGNYVDEEFYDDHNNIVCEECFFEHYFECEGYHEIYRINEHQPIDYNNELYSLDYYNRFLRQLVENAIV